MDNLLVSLAITALAYGAGPLILAFIGRKVWTVKEFNIFSVCYTAAVFFVFSVLAFVLGEGQSGAIAPAFIWGIIFNRLASAKMRGDVRLVIKKYRKPEPTTDERDSSLLSCNQAQNIVEPHLNEDRGPDHGDGYAPNVETKAEPEKITIKTRRTDKGFMPILLTASMGVGCVALAMLCVVLWTDIKQMKNDMNELTSKNELLEKEIENWDHKYTSMKSAKDGLLSEVRELRESTEKMGFNDFFVRCAIGLIYDGDDTYFHTTQCDNSPDSTFFVMTSKACDTLGLSPCPYCHTSEDLITIQSLIKQ